MIIGIANVLVLTAVAFLLWKKESHPLKFWFWPALLVKVSAGIALGLLYYFYYTEGDTFSYFKDAVSLADLARDDFPQYLNFLWNSNADQAIWTTLNFQQPRALFLSKAASIVCLFASDNYWIVAAYFSFASFLASWFLVKAITEHNPQASKPAVLAFLFFPSVLFWTSGLIKESLAMAALYYIVMIFLSLWNRKSLKKIHWIIIVVATWILWSLKYYYLAVLYPILIAALIYRYLLEKRISSLSVGIRILLFTVIFFLPLSIAGIIHPNFYPNYFLEVVVSNHDAFVALSSRDDVIHYSDLSPDFFSILQNTPKALFSGLFRPLLMDDVSGIKIIASVENSFLLILFLSALYSAWIRNVASRDRLGWLIVLYSCLLCLFLALSTPNFGTLSRYRVGFLPFFVLFLWYDNVVLKWIQAWVQRSFSRLVP